MVVIMWLRGVAGMAARVPLYVLALPGYYYESGVAFGCGNISGYGCAC